MEALKKVDGAVVGFSDRVGAYGLVLGLPSLGLAAFLKLTKPFGSANWSWAEIAVASLGGALLILLVGSLVALAFAAFMPAKRPPTDSAQLNAAPESADLDRLDKRLVEALGHLDKSLTAEHDRLSEKVGTIERDLATLGGRIGDFAHQSTVETARLGDQLAGALGRITSVETKLNVAMILARLAWFKEMAATFREANQNNHDQFMEFHEQLVKIAASPPVNRNLTLPVWRQPMSHIPRMYGVDREKADPYADFYPDNLTVITGNDAAWVEVLKQTSREVYKGYRKQSIYNAGGYNVFKKFVESAEMDVNRVLSSDNRDVLSANSA